MTAFCLKLEKGKPFRLEVSGVTGGRNDVDHFTLGDAP